MGSWRSLVASAYPLAKCAAGAAPEISSTSLLQSEIVQYVLGRKTKGVPYSMRDENVDACTLVDLQELTHNPVSLGGYASGSLG